MNETIWEIREALKHERTTIENINISCQQWENIINDISNSVTNISTSSHEWQLRFECQYQYNKTLMKDIQSLRAEIRMLRNGNQPGPRFEELKKLKTVGDWRKKTKDLNIEKLSLKSLQNMYERQLDSEALAYHNAHDTLYRLTNDVRNNFGTRIHEQEKADTELVLSVKTTPRKLKPIARVPPIKMLSTVSRAIRNYKSLFRRNHHAQEDQQQTTFSGLVSEKVERQQPTFSGLVSETAERQQPTFSELVLERAQRQQTTFSGIDSDKTAEQRQPTFTAKQQQELTFTGLETEEFDNQQEHTASCSYRNAY